MAVVRGELLDGTDDPGWPDDVLREVKDARRRLSEEFMGAVFVDDLPYTNGPPSRGFDFLPPDPLPECRGRPLLLPPIKLSPQHEEFVRGE